MNRVVALLRKLFRAASSGLSRAGRQEPLSGTSRASGAARRPDGVTDDPRFDPYRNRAAALFRGGEQAGVLFAESTDVEIQGSDSEDPWWRANAGVRNILELWIRIDDVDLFNCWIANDIADDLEDWRRGVFVCDGIEYECRWLDDLASIEVGRTLGVPSLPA